MGIGNILLKDEGVGVHFIRWFKERHDMDTAVSIVDGGTLGFLLLDVVCQSEYLLVIDAVKIDAKAGSLFRFTLEDLPPELLSQGTAHDVTFLQVMSQAEMLQKAPKECVILGVVPEDIKGVGVGVTSVVENTFPKIEKQVFKEIKRWGVSPTTEAVLTG